MGEETKGEGGGWGAHTKRERGSAEEGEVVGWLLNVPATCECISGTDLHRQFYVLPH